MLIFKSIMFVLLKIKYGLITWELTLTRENEIRFRGKKEHD